MDKNIPKALFLKIILTALIGAGFFIIGTICFFISGDRIIFLMSFLVLVCSIVRSISYYDIISNKKYDVLEGTCIQVDFKPLKKYYKVKIIDDSGKESTLHLGKETKTKIGYRYRFYFSQNQNLSIGNEYIDTALSSNYFLGIENLGEFSTKEDAQNVTDNETE